jgi:membrane-bound metal-dependent hydrolase YbcI (DUF457 family)
VPVGVVVYFLTWPTVGDSNTRLEIALLSGVATIAVPYILKLFLGHRGALHSVFFWLALSLAGWLLLGSVMALRLSFVGIGLGATVGGIFPDLLTPAGVEVLWPFSNRRVCLLPKAIAPRTGGWFERLLFRPLVGGGLLLLTALFIWRAFAGNNH